MGCFKARTDPGGDDWGDRALKPTKVTFFTILYNSERHLTAN